jgi:superfamily I DNA and/or RNA helicase
LKKRLKNGKSILVKVFAKSRNLPTIRELLASDARLWIDVLKPLWLSNPTQVASNIPLESGCFSLTLIDEASQLPLSDAIGCLYRSTHVVIAGDSQQMGPSAFFRKSSEQLDVLHQASYYWSSVHLTHHYRSEDPRLIAFSNRYFYNNELLAFPTARAKRHPIELNYCPEGRYVDRENEVEAKEVAKRITSALNEKKSIGVVAFSATQLAAIERQLSVNALSQLEELIENGDGFFKPLEHVQGEECDELIVSLGYGKNEEGEFHLRFGPLNQANGHKRLNVLFTRAKKSIVLFTSVRSSDFKLTDNESVQLLKNYVFMAEQNQQSSTELCLPFGLNPEKTGSTLKFNHLYKQVTDAQEMVTLLHVLSQRGWDLRLG